ncbi:thioredoxin family protein [Sphingobacterium yanglingense]|uniref:Thioredoxin 1 n=1 Tax=Sphingobacterium yanglingense TaxID=1437280 RepID=A0A4V3DDN6_9SPHI|nr:thioredoxin family protein [Sphingobacterium yanglingense]TDQ77314.1 thioredoxin 1 [Sphingobacterium yanglingense]
MIFLDQKSDKPRFMQFTAAWCGPCRVLNPIVDNIKSQKPAEVDFMRIDVDTQSDIAEEFNIRGVPTIILLDKDGKISWRHTGLASEKEIINQIDSLL